jgi:exodeoxyribonuclease VII large subunit
MTEPRKYSVQTLLFELERLMGRYWPQVLVEGEVHQITLPASGHAYFQLRESDAVLPAVMWRNDWKASSFRPVAGDRVIVRGRLGLYVQQGRVQLFANVIRPAGEGAQAREIAARKARLEAEGLLDPRRKRALPRFPRFVGLATSPSGAALHDFLRVSGERYPAARILLAGCQVQGEEAAASVIRAIALLIEDGRADVIVVARGGGSKADLVAFQDEDLARFAALSPIPLVSAVGHEIDTSLVDLVADAVAPTPSAAALLVLPDAGALRQRVDEAAGRLAACTSRLIGRRRRDLSRLSGRLVAPGVRITRARQRARELEARLERQVRAISRRDALRLAALRGRLEALSPHAVLGRGYAIVTHDGAIVRSPEAVAAGDRLEIAVQTGAFAAIVAR